MSIMSIEINSLVANVSYFYWNKFLVAKLHGLCRALALSVSRHFRPREPESSGRGVLARFWYGEESPLSPSGARKWWRERTLEGLWLRALLVRGLCTVAGVPSRRGLVVGPHTFGTAALTWKGRHFWPRELEKPWQGRVYRGLVVGPHAFGTAPLWRGRVAIVGLGSLKTVARACNRRAACSSGVEASPLSASRARKPWQRPHTLARGDSYGIPCGPTLLRLPPSFSPCNSP